MPKDLIQQRDNTSVNIGTAEYPRYSKPWIPDYLEGMFQYNAGNYLDKNAHEFAHYVFGPVEKPPLEVYNGVNAYLRKPTEINARGTQIKNYFGLKENEPLTENMLKYAEKHYIKDRGYDNNMTQFFSGIKDWKEMAKWLQEFSPAASIPLIMNNGNNTTNK